jgi:hypothetical protein
VALRKQCEEAETPENHRSNTRLQQGADLKPADPVDATQAKHDANQAEQGTASARKPSDPKQAIHLPSLSTQELP